MKTIAIDLNDVIRAYTFQFANLYKKQIEPMLDISTLDIYTNELNQVFPFESDEEYKRFIYEDNPYELFGATPFMSQALPGALTNWHQMTLANMDVKEVPNIIAVSPFEMGLTIQSSHFFLYRLGCRFREYYFPIDSSTIWDRADIVITANPKLLASKKEGKVAIKVSQSYNMNEDCKADYTFDSMMDIITDKGFTIEKIIQQLEAEE